MLHLLPDLCLFINSFLCNILPVFFRNQVKGNQKISKQPHLLCLHDTIPFPVCFPRETQMKIPFSYKHPQSFFLSSCICPVLIFFRELPFPFKRKRQPNVCISPAVFISLYFSVLIHDRDTSFYQNISLLYHIPFLNNRAATSCDHAHDRTIPVSHQIIALIGCAFLPFFYFREFFIFSDLDHKTGSVHSCRRPCDNRKLIPDFLFHIFHGKLLFFHSGFNIVFRQEIHKNLLCHIMVSYDSDIPYIA